MIPLQYFKLNLEFSKGFTSAFVFSLFAVILQCQTFISNGMHTKWYVIFLDLPCGKLHRPFPSFFKEEQPNLVVCSYGQFVFQLGFAFQ